MKTDTALKHAQNLKPGQQAQAAHLYATTEWELAYLEEELDNPLMDDKHPALEQERSAGEAALARIEEMFPGVKDQADEIESPKGLTQRAARGLSSDGQKDRTPATTGAAGGSVSTVSQPPAETSSPKPAAPGSGRNAAPRVGKTARRRRTYSRQGRALPRQVTQAAGRSVSVVSDATGGWGDEIWDFVLGGLGLSVLLLVLSKPAGLARLMSGASAVVKAVINPAVDPLRPTTGATK